MNKPFRIGIFGVGGIGGYLSALLCNKYSKGNEIEIVCLSRGENLAAIRQKGIHLKTLTGQFQVRPHVATDHPAEAGMLDLLLVCTKVYSLEGVKKYAGNLHENSLVLPLLNGVDIRERVMALLPGRRVLSGTMYIVARCEGPGRFSDSGKVARLLFGGDAGAEELLRIERIFQEAGIDGTLQENIRDRIWEKYMLISPLATTTAGLDKSTGQICASAEDERVFKNLFDELKSIAVAKGIQLPADIEGSVFHTLRALPYEATSSMHTDRRKGNPMETDTLTGYAIQAGKELGIATPMYEKMFKLLNV